MRKSQLICSLLALALWLLPAGCRSREAEKPAAPEKVTLIIKTPPIGLGNIPDVGEAEAYDLIMAAAEKFRAQYDRCDVEFVVSRYDYLDDQAQLVDKYGTPEAADLFFSGSWNLPLYVQRGWMVPLDDIISEELRSDIDESIWRQNTIDGKVYTMPFHQLQNTLMVNREMMEAAGLEAYIPKDDAVACWSTEEFRLICRELAKSLTDENTFAFMMYAANNQGDSHIMTLLRAYGCPLYDKNGNFTVNTPEGIRALEWIREMDEQELIPRGAENLELLDCINLFYNRQLAICVGNLTNMWDIRVAKDFLQYLYTDEELMKYTLGTIPVNNSVIRQYQDEIWMLRAYGENTSHVVNSVQSNRNWQGVRDVFYTQINDLLTGQKTPGEAAKAIDTGCNAALEKGRTDAG